MKLICLLSFFDDEPWLLHRAVASSVRAGASHIVAVDGPYANFPHERLQSRPSCLDAIVGAARGAVVDIHVPGMAWEGDEVAKRSFMLDRALGIADPSDWLQICDSDYEWDVDDHQDLLGRLSMTERRAAVVSYTENPGHTPVFSPARMLLRADHGLRMGANHYTYLHPGGRRSDILCRHSTEPAEDLQDLARIHHHNAERPSARADAQTAYYHIRDTQGLEA